MSGSPSIRQRFHGAHLGEAVRRRADRWAAEGILGRLWRRDPLLWADSPRPEIADRLGWLDLPETQHAELPRLEAFAAEVAGEGTTDVALLGMGGSSLAPEVFQAVFGAPPGRPRLTVLDSTHPRAVREASQRLDPRRTLFVVSSKSGGTVETMSLFRFFWERVSAAGADAGRRFAAVTDPGTALERLASERRFRATFLAPSDVGGRFSALSPFGLLPAALVGADVRTLLAHAHAEHRALHASHSAQRAAVLELAAALAEGALAGRDKLTLVASPALSSLPAWIEQLVAESLGKDGRGAVPVAGEGLTVPSAYRGDRLFVELALEEEDDAGREERLREVGRTAQPVLRIRLPHRAFVGAEMFRWEVATALAGAALRVHPFDQPDVQRAKTLAEKAMAGGASAGGERPVSAWDEQALRAALRRFAAEVREGDYVAVLAFLAPGAATDAALQGIRLWFRDWRGVATTLGYGPRFLHSSGQLHKGGPGSVHVLQIVDEPTEDLPIPETPHGFRTLVLAQAAGDAAALGERRRRLLRVDAGQDTLAGLGRIRDAMG